MKRFITNSNVLYTLGLLLVLALWWIISLSQGAGNLVFPSPISTCAALGKLFSSAFFYESLWMTLVRTLEGFGFSFALAFLLGTLSGEIPPLQRLFKPFVLVLKSVPTAALVFFFLVYSGSEMAPVWIVSILAFPILYESFVSGINAIPWEIKQSAKVDQASFLSSALRIKVPLALPYVLLGILNSFALSFKTEIMAEIIAGQTSAGLGSAIRVYRNMDPSDLSPIFAISLVAIVIVLLLDLITYLLSLRFKKEK